MTFSVKRGIQSEDESFETRVFHFDKPSVLCIFSQTRFCICFFEVTLSVKIGNTSEPERAELHDFISEDESFHFDQTSVLFTRFCISAAVDQTPTAVSDPDEIPSAKATNESAFLNIYLE